MNAHLEIRAILSLPGNDNWLRLKVL